MVFSTSAQLPVPRQARAKATVAKLIDAADAVMRTSGEAGVRIQEISKETGVSVGSIYHHFGDRDGLIRATYAHNYAKLVDNDLPLVKEFLVQMSSVGQLTDRYDEILGFIKERLSSQSSLERAAIIGTAASRPLMRQELIAVQEKQNQAATEILQIAADRGMLKPHLEPKAAAMVIFGLLLGQALADLDSEPVSLDAWSRAAMSALGGLFNGPSRSQRMAQAESPDTEI